MGSVQGRLEIIGGQAIFLVTGGACLRVHSATASSFEVISYFYELDICVFLRSVDSLFFFVDPELLVFGVRISDYARLS